MDYIFLPYSPLNYLVYRPYKSVKDFQTEIPGLFKLIPVLDDPFVFGSYLLIYDFQGEFNQKDFFAFGRLMLDTELPSELTKVFHENSFEICQKLDIVLMTLQIKGDFKVMMQAIRKALEFISERNFTIIDNPMVVVDEYRYIDDLLNNKSVEFDLWIPIQNTNKLTQLIDQTEEFRLNKHYNFFTS